MKRKFIVFRDIFKNNPDFFIYMINIKNNSPFFP